MAGVHGVWVEAEGAEATGPGHLSQSRESKAQAKVSDRPSGGKSEGVVDCRFHSSKLI